MSNSRSIKTVAIDFDSVLADTMILWTDEYNKTRHTNITKNEITTWDIGKTLPILPDEISEIFNKVWRNRWQNVPPTEPMQSQTIKRIHRMGYRISIITKRDRSTVTHVAKWLDYHDIYCDDLVFVYDNTPKAEYPFDILIDDAPVNLIDIVSPRVGILFSQPWNRDFNWPIRVNTLKEVEEKILST
jgi:5'(3')-deoxyribonucleotidase